MIKEVIGEASTIEGAKENAIALLFAPADADVKLEIVSRPQKKVLGLFGGSSAKVKASYDDGKAEPKPVEPKVTQPKPVEPKAQPKQSAPVKEAVKAPVNEPVIAKKAEKSEQINNDAKKYTAPKKRADAGPPSAEMTKAAVAYLEMMLAGLSVTDATITATESDEGIALQIECDDHGIIIGRRGETMDAMQYLLSLVVNSDVNTYVRVTLNVGNYREKRQDALIGVAKRNADHVLRTGRRAVLEPMNPYERRIIHTAVQDIDGVNSRSVGSNSERKVIIELADGVSPTGNRGKEQSGHNSHHNNHHSAAPHSKANESAVKIPVAKEATSQVKTPVQPKEDKPAFPKYGRIQ